MTICSISNNKTTAGNFMSKAAYFEKKLRELKALEEKRIALGADRDVSDPVMAAELAKVEADINRVIGLVESIDAGTGREDYYHKSGNDTLASSFAGPLAQQLGLGERPKDGDYIALFRGVNPRTSEFFVGENRQKQIHAAIVKLEQMARDQKEGRPTQDRYTVKEMEQIERSIKDEKKHDQVLGFSAVLALDKTWSLYWGQAGDEERRVMQEIEMEASRETWDWVHKQGYVRGREGAQGAESVEGAAMALLYQHCTARKVKGQKYPDSHKHTHLEIPNAVMLPNGKVTTLDGRPLYKAQREMGAYFDVRCYEKLRERLPHLADAMIVDYSGYGLRLNEETVSRELIEEHSKRSKQVNAEMNKVAGFGGSLKQAIGVRTRDAKNFVADDDWDTYQRTVIPKINPKATKEKNKKVPTIAQVKELLFKGETVAEFHALNFVSVQLALGRRSSEIEIIKDAVLKQLGLVEIPQRPDENGKIPPRRFTTREFVRLESDCIKAVYAGLNNPTWQVVRSKVDAVIDAFELEKRALQGPGETPFALTQEQREAAYALTGLGQFSFLKGAAGVGKSATLAPVFRVYNDIYKSQGRRVIGVAPMNKQATELMHSTGIESQTVQSLLAKHQEAIKAKDEGKRYKAENLINAGDIIVCDEAGTLDTYTMHALVQACHQAGARLICAGDKKQHEAVGTASLFRLMHDAAGDRVATIETIARQTPEFRPIAQALYHGNTSEAIALMGAKGQIQLFREGVNEADGLVHDLFADMKTGLPDKSGVVRELKWSDVLVLADTNEQVRALNDKFRTERFARGELSSDPADSVLIDTVLPDGQCYALDLVKGDRLLLRKNAKDTEDQKVYNGDLGTLIGFRHVNRTVDGELIADLELTVARDDGRTVKIFTSEYNAIQYGYSMTGSRSQGMTKLRSYYLPSEVTSLNAWYVAYTRGIYGAKTYLNSSAWSGFKDSVKEFRYKLNALDLMPELRESIRSSALTGQPFVIKSQEVSVMERIQGVSPAFQFPGEEQVRAQEQTEQSITILPPVQSEIEHAKAFGAAIVDLRADEQTWPADARRVAVVAAENPTSGVEVAPWTNPGSAVPPEQRRDLCETLKAMKPAIFTTKLKFIKPEPQEARYVRIDPARSAPFASLGKYPRVDGRPVAAGDGVSRSESRTESGSQAAAGSLGRYDRAANADAATTNIDSFARPLGDFERPDRGASSNNLLPLSSCGLAAAPGRRREGVLLGNPHADRRTAGGVRREIPQAQGVKTMRFDKEADAREVAAMKIDVDLTEYATHLGMEYDKQASYKGHAVFRHGAGKYDIYQAADDNWIWHDRHAGKSGDIFKLYQEVKGGTFAQAKDDVRAFQGGVLPSLGKSPEEQARIDRARDEKRQQKERERQETIASSTKDHYRTLGFMGRRDIYLSQERGISPEVLAETRWRTSKHGSAVFPHIDAEGKFCGYEYRGAQMIDGELRQFKGFTTDTEKGIYLANPHCANPTEIRFSEGGVDTLSTYQLASHEERQRILFVGTTGEPGPKTEAAIIALAERHNIRRFSMAYDRDQGGENLTAKRAARLAERFPDAQIEDVRECIGLQIGEDPNQLVQRLQGMTAEPAEIKAAPAQIEQAPAAVTPAQSIEPEQSTEHETETRPRGRGI